MTKETPSMIAYGWQCYQTTPHIFLWSVGDYWTKNLLLFLCHFYILGFLVHDIDWVNRMYIDAETLGGE